MRAEAAGLYDAAFGAKLSIAIPDKASRLAVLQDAFSPDFCFVAMSGEELVGIAGFKTEAGSLTGRIGVGALRARLGFWKGMRALLVLALFDRPLQKGQLLMDGISVSPAMRGSGVGSALLHQLIAHARARGCEAIRLDVIDTNPAARRLYERIGFVATKTESFSHLRWLLGFGAATTMEYALQASA